MHKGAVDPCTIGAAGAVPALSTISFPSSHLGEGAPLLTEEGTFESCGGSQCTTARFSAGRRGFESRWRCHIHLPVAQLDEQRATNAKACRFESCREGQSSMRAANLAPWRNRNAAVCKTAMSRGSTGRGFQHALVDQLDGQPSSKRPDAGSSPVERAIIRQLAPVG